MVPQNWEHSCMEYQSMLQIDIWGAKCDHVCNRNQRGMTMTVDDITIQLRDAETGVPLWRGGRNR